MALLQSSKALRIGAGSRPAFKTVSPKAILTKARTTTTKAKTTNGADRFKKSTGLEAPAVNGKRFPLQLGFTASNELFVSRLAMLGFSAGLIGEILTGKGIVAQLGYEVGVPVTEVDGFIAFLILFNAIAAVLPTSQTFVPQEQELVQKQRKTGALQDPTISLLEPKKFFGFSRFGFTKENELFVGRTAQLGFASAILGEVLTGKGPLAQFDFETGISLRNTEFGLLVFIAFFLFAAINPGTGKFVDEDAE